MNRIKPALKKIITIFGAFVLLVILLFVLSISFSSRTKIDGPTPTPIATPGVAPDWANVEKAAQDIAKDTSANKGTDGEKLLPSKSATRMNSITYTNGTASLVKQIYTVEDAKKGIGIKKLIGEPEVKLYGPDAEFGLFLYAYPTKGVAYIANEVTDTVSEVWYFTPTTLPEFLKTWGKDYSEKFTPAGF